MWSGERRERSDQQQLEAQITDLKRQLATSEERRRKAEQAFKEAQAEISNMKSIQSANSTYYRSLKTENATLQSQCDFFKRCYEQKDQKYKALKSKQKQNVLEDILSEEPIATITQKIF